MRYQTYRYVTDVDYMPAFIEGDPPVPVRSRRTVSGAIVAADSRKLALSLARELYGNESAGVIALDVNCTWCEDGPVPDAREWITGKSLPACPCPRCGKAN